MAEEQEDSSAELIPGTRTVRNEQTAAPELLANTAASIPASPVLTQPNTQISPQGGTPLQQFLNLAAGVIGGGIGRSNPEVARFIQNQVQNNMEQARKKRAGDQINAASTLLSQAYESGDPKVISKAHEMLGKMMEGAEPEAQQHFGDLAIKTAQTIGQQKQRTDAAQKLLQALPEAVRNGPVGKALGDLVQSNVDPETAKLFTQHMLDQILPKPMTATQQLAQQKLALTQLATMRDKMTPEQNAQLDAQMTAVGLHPIPAEQAISAAQREKYQEAGINLTGIRTQDELEQKGYPKLLAEYNSRKKREDQEFQKKLALGNQEAMKDYVDLQTQPDPRTILVDPKTGAVMAATSKYDENKKVNAGVALRLNKQQSDVRLAGENVLFHVDQMIPHMKYLAQSGGKAGAWLNATFESWSNNPDAVILQDQLGHMVSQALNSALASGLPGGGLRGVTGAQYAEPISVTKTDSIQTAIGKTRTLLSAAESREKAMGIPINPRIAEYRTALTAMEQGIFPGTVITDKKTGQKKTWDGTKWQE